MRPRPAPPPAEDEVPGWIMKFVPEDWAQPGDADGGYHPHIGGFLRWLAASAAWCRPRGLVAFELRHPDRGSGQHDGHRPFRPEGRDREPAQGSPGEAPWETLPTPSDAEEAP